MSNILIDLFTISESTVYVWNAMIVHDVCGVHLSPTQCPFSLHASYATFQLLHSMLLCQICCPVPLSCSYVEL